MKDKPGMAIGGGGSSAVGMAPLFSPWEAEQRIEALVEYDVTDVGSASWMKQHESLEQLNLQAHQSAQQAGDEYVLEALLTFDKLKLLVHELLVMESWRLNVFPRIKKGLVELKATMRGYFCLFHEATLVNLLTVCLHHAHAVEALGEDAVELVDYLARRLVDLNHRGRQWANRGAESCDERMLLAKEQKPKSDGDDATARVAKAHAEADRLDKQTPLESMEDQAIDVIIQVSVGSVTLVRYICEHLNSLPLSVLVRCIETHDLLCSVVPIIENPPWTRRLKKSGVWQKLVDNAWEEVPVDELLKLTKTEGQVWLALFALVCNNEVRKRYHFNSFRKGQLTRARKYMNEVLLDQLPVLADVQRFIDELAMMDVPEPTAAQGGSSVLRMEQVGTTQEKLNKTRDWEVVALEALGPKCFGAQSDSTDADLRRLVDNVYGLEGVDDVLNAESEATKIELYSQPLSTLELCILSAHGHVELVRVKYVLAGGEANRVGKVTTNDQGKFVRRRWVIPKDLITTEPSCADIPFSSCSEDTISEMLPCVLKAEMSFEGESPVSCAVASEAIGFDDLKPQKRWVQLGSIKEKIALQVQLVRDTEGGAFRVADAFVSTPSPV